MQESRNSSINNFVKSASEDVVRAIETNEKEREKKGNGTLEEMLDKIYKDDGCGK